MKINKRLRKWASLRKARGVRLQAQGTAMLNDIKTELATEIDQAHSAQGQMDNITLPN